MPVEVAMMYDVGVIELSVTLAGWNPFFFFFFFENLSFSAFG